ncbi:hypothetical protein GOBAR_AA22376 [Gossypium barbadense]|uniref:Uncharacterized protein n=1 Tax=Gossypium barbadense TaxID=3634 RepID=A0A2P5X4M9_GOSBA|nr:hypothetical protein GOBAR_AA22376 [Gossypium barbadense]
MNLEEMLTKFISVLETRFQNTETTLKNQQASIQGLEIQIGQLTKLISEQPQGSLPSNTESNPREQLNAITIQDEEGLVEPEPELRQEIVVSKGKGEVDHSEQKPEIRSKSTHEPYSSNNKESIYKERRVQIEELDEWRTHKLRTHDKPKPRHDELNISPNQLKVGDKVLLDAADPYIATPGPNGAIPLMVLSIFPYGTVEVIHPKFGTFKPWANLSKQHVSATRPCLEAVVDTEKLTRMCDMPVPITRGRHCQTNIGVRI